MAQLPTIREIANELSAAESINFTYREGQEDITNDDYNYDGYANCYLSRYDIEYTKGSEALQISEVIGETVDEHGESTGEEVTIDYLWQTLTKWDDCTSSMTEAGGGPSPEELKQVIRNFMA